MFPNPMAARNPTAEGAALLLFLLLLFVLCSDNPSGPEDDPPLIEILFPTAGNYDSDGDGLVDIEVTFRDTGSGLNEQSVAIESDRPLGPSGTGGTNLLTRFDVVERDSFHIKLEETTKALLPAGPVSITIAASDRNDNRMAERAEIQLPEAALHRRMESPFIVTEPIALEILPDGRTGYLFAQDVGLVLPFDVEEFEFLEPVEMDLLEPFDSVYDPSTERIYVVDLFDSRIAVINPGASLVEGYIDISSGGNRITRAPDGLLYVSRRAFSASIAVINPLLRTEIELIDLGYVNTLNPGEPALLSSTCWLPGQDGFFVSLRVDRGGVLHVRSDGTTIETYDLEPDLEDMGFAFEIECDSSRGLIYAADLNGIHAISPAQASIARSIVQQHPNQAFTYIDTAHSGRRIVVAVHSIFPDWTDNWLIDLDSFTLVENLPSTTVPPGDEEIAFRADGQIFFAASRGLAVYLNRE